MRREYRYRGFPAAIDADRKIANYAASVTGKPVPNPETKALGCYIMSPDILKL